MHRSIGRYRPIDIGNRLLPYSSTSFAVLYVYLPLRTTYRFCAKEAINWSLRLRLGLVVAKYGVADSAPIRRCVYNNSGAVFTWIVSAEGVRSAVEAGWYSGVRSGDDGQQEAD